MFIKNKILIAMVAILTFTGCNTPTVNEKTNATTTSLNLNTYTYVRYIEHQKQDEMKKKVQSTFERSVLIKNSLTLIGIPYKWGGTTKKGFDCSGMVQYLYRTILGVDLPRTANSMATSEIGKKINKDDLDIGDLVFFNTNGKEYSHVGLYVGDDKFIHAPNKRKRIKIDSLNNSYYSKRFTLAKTFFV